MFGRWMKEGEEKERGKEGGRNLILINACFCIEFVYFDNYIYNINV